jgi:hypothetical protein
MAENLLYPSAAFDKKYPAPPSFHWAWLLFIPISIAIIVIILLESAEISAGLVKLIVFIAIALFAIYQFYLCMWITTVTHSNKAFFWTIIAIGYAVILLSMPSPHQDEFSLSILVAFILRDQIQEHYNNNEPIGLKLGVTRTFFLGVIYIQYHLYHIAREKKLAASSSLRLEANSDQQDSHDIKATDS